MEKASPCRRRLLTSTAIGLAGCLALSQPVSADNECGAITGNSVTCTPAGNNYTSGITYKPTDDLTMVVQDGVTVTPSGGNEGIDVSFTASGLYDLDLRLYDTDATTDVTTTGSGAEGIFIRNAAYVILLNQAEIRSSDAAIEIQSAEDVIVTNSGTLNAYGDGGIVVVEPGSISITNYGDIGTDAVKTHGIYILNPAGDSTIIQSMSGSIIVEQEGSHGVYVYNHLDGSTGNFYMRNEGGIVTYGYFSNGILLSSINGYVEVIQTNTSEITTYGNSSDAIQIRDTQAGVTISADGTIRTYGNDSNAISTRYTGDGTSMDYVEIVAGGDITTHGISSDGIAVQDTLGDVTVTLSGTGSNTTYGDEARGIYIVNSGKKASITADGAIGTNGDLSSGILVIATSSDVTMMLSGTGSIATRGYEAPGIYILNSDENVTITTDGSIRTNDDSSSGIHLNDTSGDVAVMLSATGSIRTFGYNSDGIFVRYTGDGIGADHVEIVADGGITTYGWNAQGIDVNHTQGSVTITQSDTGSITTYGADAHGIYAADVGTGVTLTIEGLVTASGVDSDAARILNALGGVAVDVSGSVSGGARNGTGVYLDNPNAASSTISVEGTGTIGALSDIAIKALEPVTINNAGTITGIVTLGSGDDVFTNDHIWYLRNHADMDGDGVRDMEGVASADFGGGTDQFTNTGTLSLPKGSQTLWQGEIVNLETFTNSGTIDLQDGIVGDTLSISGNFISNGGSLVLDAVLDDGSSVPQADVLTLYEATLGSDATQIVIANAGGLGGATTGNGILLIDAQKPSDGGAFELAGQVISGAYEYDLHYDATAFDWYLQSAAALFAGTAEYPALMTAALLGFGADWSALHNRVGDLRWEEEEEQEIEPAAWTSRPASGFRSWLQLTGARQEIDAGAPFEQRVAKLEGGVDRSFAVGNGTRALLGAFAGTGRAEQDLEHSTSTAAGDMAVAGVYGGYRSGRFYGDAILKYEHQSADLNSVATDANGVPFDVDLFGGSIEIGYRFILGRSYVQPRLRVSYAHAWASSFDDGSGETIDLQDAQSLSGEVAARLGLQLGEEIGDLYMEAGVQHEALGDTEARVSGLSFVDELPGTIAFLSAGMAVNLTPNKLSLMLDAGYAKGDAAEEFTATGALRMMY